MSLPKPTGLYAVGTETLSLTDTTRTPLRGTETRRWMATIWYPSEQHAGAYPYMPGTLQEGEVWGVKVMTHAKPQAVPLRNKKFPLIIAIPGRGNERQRYTILLEELASQGYIVVAMDQPYVAGFVKFLDGNTVTLTLRDAWKLPRDRDYRYTYDDDVIRSTLKDIAYVLDHLNVLGPLAELIDPQTIILLGHSLGANSAHLFGFHDRKVNAIVDIDCKITERPIFGRIGVPQNPDAKPVLFIRAMMQYQDDVGNQLEKISNATVWRPLVQHSAFSDDAYFAAKIAGFGDEEGVEKLMHWIFKRGPYFSNIDTSVGQQTVEQWFAEYCAYIVAWLKHYAKTQQHGTTETFQEPNKAPHWEPRDSNKESQR